METMHRYGHVHYILYGNGTTNNVYTILISFKRDKTSLILKNLHFTKIQI